MNMSSLHFAVFSLTFVFLFSHAVSAQKPKVEDVVLKHLDSIGIDAKTMVAVADVKAKFISTKDQTVLGRAVFASDGVKNFFGMNLNSTAYPGEKFIFDGKKANIGSVRVNNRSTLGNFIQSFDFMIESLLGGVLTTSWVMKNVNNSKGKLSMDGIKKIDGKEHFVLSFSKKGGGDLNVTLYFETDTYRHTRTVYRRSSSAGIGLTPDQSSRFQETKFVLTEKFSDFKVENGLTLPHQYEINYSVTGQQGTTEIEWAFQLMEFAVNQPVDPKTFEITGN